MYFTGQMNQTVLGKYLLGEDYFIHFVKRRHIDTTAVESLFKTEDIFGIHLSPLKGHLLVKDVV